MSSETAKSSLGWLSSLLVAALIAVALGEPTGFALLVFVQSRNVVLWLGVFPLVLAVGVVLVLRRWQTIPARRWVVLLSSAVLLAVADAAVVFGGLHPRTHCTWELSDEVAANTELSPGFPLASDGNGAYSDAVDGVDTFIKHSLKLAIYEPQLWRPKTTVRHLLVDLSKPVPASGAVPLGIISTATEFKPYWYQDSTGMVRTVHAIPRGTTVVSDRTDVLLDIDGRRHRLTMGQWRTRYCDAEEGIDGSGTTDVRLTRLQEQEYTADAPIGSVARLWDISGRTPKNKGLYYFGLHAHFVAKSRP